MKLFGYLPEISCHRSPGLSVEHAIWKLPKHQSESLWAFFAKKPRASTRPLKSISDVGMRISEPNPRCPFLAEHFPGVLLQRRHRMDIGDRAVADPRDAKLGQAIIGGHALHNHHVHR